MIILLIEILFSLAFIILLGKAIIETIWGSSIIIHGLFWHTIAFALNALAFSIRTTKKVFGFGKKPQPRISLARGFKRTHGA